MINVGYIALSDDASSFYRLQGCLPFIVSKRVNFHDISRDNLHSWNTYLKLDIVIIQRPFAQEHINIIELVQLMGKRVISDYDDDVLNIPHHNPAHQMYQEHRQKVMQCIRKSDEVWVSTDAIKNSFDRLNKKIHVLHNCHNDYLFPQSGKKAFNHENKIAFYRGGGTHLRDLRHYLKPICDIMRGNQTWKFMFLGVDNNDEFLESVEDINNCYVSNYIPVMQYHPHVHTMNPSAFICPLDDTLLNRAKSNCSWLEATYAGAAFFGNKSLPEFNMDCILPLSLFGKAISEGHIETMKKKNEESWDWIVENRLLSNINKKRLERVLSW